MFFPTSSFLLRTCLLCACLFFELCLSLNNPLFAATAPNEKDLDKGKTQKNTQPAPEINNIITQLPPSSPSPSPTKSSQTSPTESPQTPPPPSPPLEPSFVEKMEKSWEKAQNAETKKNWKVAMALYKRFLAEKLEAETKQEKFTTDMRLNILQAHYRLSIFQIKSHQWKKSLNHFNQFSLSINSFLNDGFLDKNLGKNPKELDGNLGKNPKEKQNLKNKMANAQFYTAFLSDQLGEKSIQYFQNFVENYPKQIEKTPKHLKNLEKYWIFNYFRWTKILENSFELEQALTLYKNYAFRFSQSENIYLRIQTAQALFKQAKLYFVLEKFSQGFDRLKILEEFCQKISEEIPKKLTKKILNKSANRLSMNPTAKKYLKEIELFRKKGSFLKAKRTADINQKFSAIKSFEKFLELAENDNNPEIKLLKLQANIFISGWKTKNWKKSYVQGVHEENKLKFEKIAQKLEEIQQNFSKKLLKKKKEWSSEEKIDEKILPAAALAQSYLFLYKLQRKMNNGYKQRKILEKIIHLFEKNNDYVVQGVLVKAFIYLSEYFYRIKEDKFAEKIWNDTLNRFLKTKNPLIQRILAEKILLVALKKELEKKNDDAIALYKKIVNLTKQSKYKIINQISKTANDKIMNLDTQNAQK